MENHTEKYFVGLLHIKLNVLKLKLKTESCNVRLLKLDRYIAMSLKQDQGIAMSCYACSTWLNWIKGTPCPLVG